MRYLILILQTLLSLASTGVSAAECTLEAELTGVIGPASVDLLKRAERRAEAKGCESILLLINTPGGLLESTRMIVSSILNSPRPYLCLVAPSGGHAGSAGAIILQACHVNGALHGTNLGAATPVSPDREMPKDLREKVINDTRSWLESLTSLRGRDKKFGEAIILEAKAVPAEEALKLKAIDFAGESKQDFLEFARGRKVKLPESRITAVVTGAVERFEQDTRFKILSLLTDPEWAYMLLLASLALLYFEITHTGVVLPGVAGAIGLVIALIALHKLDVEYGGLLLIFLGIAMMVAEMFLPTFGLVGAAGVACLVLGSLFLFDPVRSGGYHLPYGLILVTTLLFSTLLVAVSVMFFHTRQLRKKGGFEDLMGAEGRVVVAESPMRGTVELRGELWKFEARQGVVVNDKVIVRGHKGLVLRVDKES